MPVIIKVAAVFSKAMSLRMPMGVVPLLLAWKLMTVFVLFNVVPPTELVVSTPPLIVPPVISLMLLPAARKILPLTDDASMAATLLVMAPVITLFFLAQKAFVEGVTLTGVKG